jgi:hypothetical protein
VWFELWEWFGRSQISACQTKQNKLVVLCWVVLGFYEEEQKVLVFKLFLEWIQFQVQKKKKWIIGSGSTLVLEEKKFMF